jgi:hypothetical protein
MRFVKRLVLRHRARRTVLSALRFAERLRKSDSEFAPSYADTISGVGDELALLAQRMCRDEADRRAILAGLLLALQGMYRGNPGLAQRLTLRLAPRILVSKSPGMPPPFAQYLAV